MIYSFITDSDLDVAMKRFFREQITELQAKLHIQTLSEGAAFSLIKSKLNNRYDLAALFPPVVEWDSQTPFVLGAYCCKKDVIYQALQAGADHDPCENASAYWKKSDPRDPLLVLHCAVITIYNMMRSVAPRKISDELHDAYEESMDWLDAVKEGSESPDYPLRDEGTDTIPHGSAEQNEHYY